MTQRNIPADDLMEVDYLLSRFHRLLAAENDASPAADSAMQYVKNLQDAVAQRMTGAASSSPVVTSDRRIETRLAVDQIRHIVAHAASHVDTGQDCFPWNDAYMRELHRALTVLGPESELPPAPPPSGQARSGLP